MFMYEYGLLRSDISPTAETHNNALLGEDTLGIEVTMDSLSQRCGLGNIDPQHQHNGTSSAIEESLTWPLPKPGSKLVTLRSDKDSIGAMAVLTLRARGRVHKIDKLLISWVGAIDRHGYKTAVEVAPELAKFFPDNNLVIALNVICLQEELFPTIEEKVFQVGEILCRELSVGELQRIKDSRRREAREFVAEDQDGFILVRVAGQLRSARDWANHNYPVAVIYDDRFESDGGVMKRWSVIKQPSAPFNRQRFEIDINIAEATARGLPVEVLKRRGLSWGGPQNIVSSSQGIGRETLLSHETILKVVQTNLG